MEDNKLGFLTNSQSDMVFKAACQMMDYATISLNLDVFPKYILVG